jgi:hypothetical protein
LKPIVWRDNERALNNPASKTILREHGVNSWNFEPYFGAYADPCDNNWNSGFRSRVNSAESGLNFDWEQSGDGKMEIIRQAYYDFDPGEIHKYFEKTGLIGDTPPREVISNLIQDATRKHKEKFDLHYRHQLVAFVAAARNAGVRLHEGDGLIGPWWEVIRAIK